MYVRWCLGIVVMSVVGVVPWRRLAARLLKRDEVLKGSWSSRGGKVAGVCFAAVLSLCTLSLSMTNGNRNFENTCFTIAFVAGVAVCVLFWCWSSVYVANLGRYVGVHLGAACAVGAVFYVVTRHLPSQVAVAVTVVMPLASAVCLLPVYPAVMPERRRSASRGGKVFSRAVVAVALAGFAESFMRAVFQSVDVVFNSFDYQWVLFGSALAAAVLIAVVARFRPGKDSIGRVNYVVMLIIVALFLISPAVWGLGYAADVATTVCFCLFYLFVWTALVQIAAFYRLHMRTAFGIGLGVAYLGCLLGSFAGTYLAPFILSNYRLQMACAMVSALLVLTAMLFVANERTFVELLDADDESPSTPRRFQLRCESVAQLYGLTPRETQVMTLIAKGRTSQRIQEVLELSASTVNTHVNHIYRKMDVHGRQEMIDVIERDA